jgi:hypothetical protein
LALSIGQKQELFSALLPRLLDHALDLQLRVRLRELWRTKEQAEWNAEKGTGIANSLHCIGLAIDLYVRKPSGKVLWAKDHYVPLGEYWEDLHPLTRWGGRFGDSGHFSITHDGVQ